MKPNHENNLEKEGSFTLDLRLNQTLKSVQKLLSGRSFPGKVLLSRKGDSLSGIKESASSSNVGGHEIDESMDQNAKGEQVDSHINGSDVVTEFDGTSKAPDESLHQPSSSEPPRVPFGGRATDSARVARFRKELAASTVDLDALRELAWSGVPPDMRPTVWRLLLGYAPPNSDRREMLLALKRQEYLDDLAQYFDISDADRTEEEIHTLRQISVDVPRTVPDVTFFHQTSIQASLERILYIWAIRHPASGYVQGINDLATPFLIVFLSEHFGGDMENWMIAKLSKEKLQHVEADCYWCLSKLLDGIQDHYTFAQPGIQRLVFKLKELVRRIDEPVSKHLEEQSLEYLQFAFRWFNCLLIREIPFTLVTRLWDTYLAEGDSFPEYLVYVCASFLLTWSDQLQQFDFQEMVLFLQHLPTRRWTHQELEMVLSRAFMWRVMFDRSPSHFNSN
ncbi:hypothetical protein O6H91_07G006400 [Diphasiastrum complanatum]|uniref:Uncharacterized protein n=1 Tax=Diphasiastrum complanatum TaxID=34168 RepID=A0ACC2D2I9_DIPCM|nr:hypothetical protein O6H91_07G006400 [Diphasiastrum complanatum]